MRKSFAFAVNELRMLQRNGGRGKLWRLSRLIRVVR